MNCRYVSRLATLPGYERRGIGTMLAKAGLQQVDMADPHYPVAIAATRKAEKLYERCGFVKLEVMELVEPINEFGEAIETTYSWSLMKRDPPC